MNNCPFCTIGRGEVDEELLILRTEDVFAVPTLKQRPKNPGQVIICPSKHVTSLADLCPASLLLLFDAVTRVRAAALAGLSAAGTTILSNENAPDQLISHLHVHVIPRFAADNLVIPNTRGTPASREQRIEIAARLRAALTGPVAEAAPF